MPPRRITPTHISGIPSSSSSSSKKPRRVALTSVGAVSMAVADDFETKMCIDACRKKAKAKSEKDKKRERGFDAFEQRMKKLQEAEEQDEINRLAKKMKQMQIKARKAEAAAAKKAKAKAVREAKAKAKREAKEAKAKAKKKRTLRQRLQAGEFNVKPRRKTKPQKIDPNKYQLGTQQYKIYKRADQSRYIIVQGKRRSI